MYRPNWSTSHSSFNASWGWGGMKNSDYGPKFLQISPQVLTELYKESLAALTRNIVKLKLKTAPSLAISYTK